MHLVAISDAQRADNTDVPYLGTVHNGIDLDAYPYREKKDDFLVYIGRANPDKGPKEAITIARRAGLPLQMILKRSEPPEREYFEHEIEPLLASDIELHENVSHEMKVDLLGRARAMIFPIRWPEPFGLVMVEAMACGTPVVTTNWGAAPELVDDGVTGFRRDGDDDLVEAIGAARALSPRPPAASGSRSCFSGAAMVRGYEARLRQAPRSAELRTWDFHYGRSVITMAGDGPSTRPSARPRDRRPARLASTATRSSAASRSRSTRARSTPSWAPTARASRRSPTRCSPTPRTR